MTVEPMILEKETALYEESAISDSIQTVADAASAAQTTANGGLIESVPIYYRKGWGESTNPITVLPSGECPTDSTYIWDSTTSDSRWSYSMPAPKRNCSYFTCNVYRLAGDNSNTKRFTTVRCMEEASYLSSWVAQSDTVQIDGGKIFANSVTSDAIQSNSISLGKLDTAIQIKNTTYKFTGTGVYWQRLGTLTLEEFRTAVIELHSGDGYNGGSNQTSSLRIKIKTGNKNTSASSYFGVEVDRDNASAALVKVIATSTTTCVVWVYFPWNYHAGYYTVEGPVELDEFGRSQTNVFNWVHDSSQTHQTSEPIVPSGSKNCDVVYRVWTDDHLIFNSATGLTIYASGINSKVNIKSTGVTLYDQNGGIGAFLNSNGLSTYASLSASTTPAGTSTDTNSTAFFGSTVRIGKAGASKVTISNSSVDIYDSARIRLSLGTNIELYDNAGALRLYATSSGIRLGVLAENQYNVYASGSAVQIRKNSTVLAEYSSTIRLGQSGSNNVFIDPNGVHIYDGNYELGYFGSHARIGRTDIAYTLMNSDGVSLWKYNGSQAVCISSFTQNGANIGQNNDIYVNIASTGFKIYDRSLSENAIVFSAGSSMSSPYIEIGRPVSNTGIRLRLSDEAINFHKSSKTATYGIEVEPGDGTTYLTASTNFKTAGRFVSPYTYSNQSSSTTAANLYISSDGRIFRRSSSSERYKKNISDLNEESFAPELLYDLPVRQFAYKKTDNLMPGFIAEEIEKAYPVAAIYSNDMVEDWSERIIIPPMLALIQKQKKLIDDLTDRITKLERSQ